MQSLSNRYGTLFNILQKFYPSHNWDRSRLRAVSFKLQKHLFLVVQVNFIVGSDSKENISSHIGYSYGIFPSRIVKRNFTKKFDFRHFYSLFETCI